MYADDLGLNDIGYNGYTKTKTPFIDSLAMDEGLILTSNYVERLCTPTRATFLTGRYPIRYGLQHSVLANDKPYALTRQVSLLSDEFKYGGYDCHHIGKWHLGFSSWEYTPTYRGFDTFNGFYSGYSSYWNHIYKHQCFDAPEGKNCNGHDLRINEEKAIGFDGNYGIMWERDQVLSILKQYVDNDDDDDDNDNDNDKNPFFMYIGWRASHIPSQAPPRYLAMYNDDENEEKLSQRAHRAQTTVLDTMLSQIVRFMKLNNLWDNTLIVFSSDNGGQINFGDNSPLRGFKNTTFEGGIKVPGFISGGFLDEQRRGKKLNKLIHSTDWYPTLLSAAGLDINYPLSQRRYNNDYINNNNIINDENINNQWNNWLNNNHETVSHPYLRKLDGKDMWNIIQYDDNNNNNDDDDEINNREILLDMDPHNCYKDFCGSIRYGKWKYIYGNNGIKLDKWDMGNRWNREWDTKTTDIDIEYNVLDGSIKCDDIIPDRTSSTFSCWESDHGCLFNIDDDPCEYYDVAKDNIDIVQYLKQRLKYYYNSQINYIYDEESTPISAEICAPYNFDGFWESFMKIENQEWEQSILIDMDLKYNQQMIASSHDLYNYNNNNNSFSLYIRYFFASLVVVFIIVWLIVSIKIIKRLINKRNNDNVHSMIYPKETTPLIIIN